MAQETIQNIKDAELKAQQVQKDAEAERTALIKKAREEGAAFKAKVTDNAKAAAMKAVAAVEETKDDVMSKASAEAEAIIRGFSGNVQEKREEAIQTVISEIV